MSSKKNNQHLVSKTYLKHFSQKNEQDPKGKDFNIFILSKIDNTIIKKSLDNNTYFTKNKYYDLENDPNQIIENQLSKIENNYNKHLTNIKNNQFQITDILYITHFMLLQFRRVEKTLNTIQDFANNIVNAIYDIHNIDERGKSKEIAKKQLLQYKIQTFYKSNLMYEMGTHILLNYTNIDYITSDSPVINKLMYLQDLKKILIFNNIEYNSSHLNEKKMVYFFPLNKKIALLVTEHLKFDKNSIQTICLNLNIQINSINCLMYHNAIQNIYAEDKITLENLHNICTNNLNAPSIVLEIVSDNNIQRLAINSYKNENNMLILELYDNIELDILKINIKEITLNDKLQRKIHSKSVEVFSYDTEENILILKGINPYDL